MRLLPQLGRLLIDDAGALTVRGVAQLPREAPALRQLGLRNSLANHLEAAGAAPRRAPLAWRCSGSRGPRGPRSGPTRYMRPRGCRLDSSDTLATRPRFLASSSVDARAADLGAIKSGIDEHRSNEAIAPHTARAKEPEQPYGH